REHAVVERVPVDRTDELVERALLLHPRGELAAGVAADRAALDREAHVAVGAAPHVAESRADDAPADERGAEALVRLLDAVPVDDRRRVDSRQARLPRHVYLLP